MLTVPKVIKNLKEKITRSAFQLFADKDYNDVNMKDEADDAGIAVGTLYNYYSNKQELFLVIFKEQLNLLYNKLNRVINEEDDINEFVTLVYDEILKINGFSEEILRSTITKKHKSLIVDTLKDNLIVTIKNVLSDKKDNTEFLKRDEDRTIHLVLFSIIYLVKDFPEER